MAIPCFADVKKNSQKLGLFFHDFVYKIDIFRTAPGTDMALPRQPVFWAFLVNFLSVFQNKLRISVSSCTPTF